MSLSLDFLRAVRRGPGSPIFGVYARLALAGAVFAGGLVAWSLLSRQGLMSGFGAMWQALAYVLFFLVPYALHLSMARARGALFSAQAREGRRLLRDALGTRLGGGGVFLLPSVLLFLGWHGHLVGSGFRVGTLPVVLLGAGSALFVAVGAMCAAVLARGRWERVLVQVAVLGALAFALRAYLLALSNVSGVCFHGVPDDITETWSLSPRLLVWILWLQLCGGVWLFEAASARLVPATEERSLRLRRLLVVQVGVSALGVLLCGVLGRPDAGEDFSLCVQGSVYLAVWGLVLATAPVARERPGSTSLLGPGPVRGLRLAVLLLVGWGGVCALLNLLTQDAHSAPLWQVLAPAVSALLLLSLSLGAGGRWRAFACFALGVGLVSGLTLLLKSFLLRGLSGPLGGLSLGLLAALAALASRHADRVLVARERRAQAA